MDAQERCPNCGAENAIPIRYGYSGPQMEEDSLAGRIVLGGCAIFPDSPDHRCRECGHEWRLFTNVR